MIKLAQDEQTRPKYCSQGGYCRFRRCQARYCFHSILGLRSTEPRTALDYGRAIHCALPHLQRGNVVKGAAAFAESWKDRTSEEDEKRNFTRAMSTLDQWYESHVLKGTRPYTIVEPPKSELKLIDRRSADEFPFLVDLSPGDQPDALPFYGLIDGLGKSKNDPSYWVLEYKTTSELGTRFVNAFQLNLQIISYATALTILLPNYNIQGGYVEALRSSKTNADSLCIPVFVYRWEMEAFVESYLDTCTQITQCLDSGRWQQDFSACTTFSQHGSPGYLCNFHDLCKAEDWRTMLAAYVIDQSSPFEELTEGDAQNAD